MGRYPGANGAVEIEVSDISFGSTVYYAYALEGTAGFAAPDAPSSSGEVIMNDVFVSISAEGGRKTDRGTIVFPAVPPGGSVLLAAAGEAQSNAFARNAFGKGVITIWEGPGNFQEPNPFDPPPPILALTEDLSSQSYSGLFPIMEGFGLSEPIYITGPAEEQPGIAASTAGDTKLLFSAEGAAFASIVVPGVIGDDPLTLSFNNYVELVEPGTALDFLALFPDGVLEFALQGSGLSAGSVTGFTFTRDGVADVSMRVVTVPEPSSLLLAGLSILMVAGCRSRRRTE